MLTNDGIIHLEIISALGRQIKVLAEGRYSKGLHSLFWDCTDQSGQHVASGTYICRLAIDGAGAKLIKVLMLK